MKQRRTFYKNFNLEEENIIKEYFANLNNNISLTKKETIKINEDFEKAIEYYLKNGKSLKETLKILSIDNLGDIYQKEPENWYPLDSAAKIYPLSMRDNLMSVYRVSCYLKEDIVAEIYQIALLFTMKRFPTFRTSVRKGFFWHYLDGIKKRFHIHEEKKLPCSYINVSNIGKQSFKSLYYKNRISIECFHTLTDGTGATIFLSTLVATYLKLLKEINRTLGITILLITHEMEVVKRICDQVAVIDKGRLIEQGTVSEIFSNPKTELAQEFISSTFHITLPEEYLENLSDTPKHAKSYPIIKFEFTGRSVDAPLLSQASKKFGVELSILTSQIDYAGGVKFGFTIAEVEGDEDAITQAKVYLMENNVRVEVLGYVQ